MQGDVGNNRPRVRQQQLASRNHCTIITLSNFALGVVDSRKDRDLPVCLASSIDGSSNQLHSQQFHSSNAHPSRYCLNIATKWASTRSSNIQGCE